MLKSEIPYTKIYNTAPRLIEVSGSHQQMGRQIGEAARNQIQHSVQLGKCKIASTKIFAVFTRTVPAICG
jgi:hypothetical protein